MSIRAIRPDKSYIDFDIPESRLEQYETDIEMNVPQGHYPREVTVRRWCKFVGIKCTEV